MVSDSSHLIRYNRLGSSEKHPVLLAEDNGDDIIIAQRMWKKANIKNSLYVVEDGEEALDFLFRRGDYDDSPKVGLLLLDLSLPRADGFEVLGKIRKSRILKRLPVLVLSGSNREKELNLANFIGCDGFIVKPLTFDNFMKAISDIQRFIEFILYTHEISDNQ